MSEKKQPCPRLDVQKFVGRWVSLHPKTQEIIADGASLKEARDAAIGQGIDRPLLLMVPKSEGFFLGMG